MMKKFFAGLAAFVMFCGVAQAGKVKITKSKSAAYTIDLPQWERLTVIGAGAYLLVMKNGKVVFDLDSIHDGAVGFESMGKVTYNKKANRVEIKFNATEEAPEYSGKAKAVLHYNLANKKFKAACGQKICEVLP